VKIIRNKNTAVSEGYGFVEFASHEAAEQVLRTFNGCPIPNTDQIFRLNWAAFGVGKVTTDCESPTSNEQAPFPAHMHHAAHVRGHAAEG
jgi:RNA recognition motif-containing protein